MELVNQYEAVVKLGNEICGGGEGRIYEIHTSQDLIAKIYHPHILEKRQAELEKKLPLMISLTDEELLEHMAWPRYTLRDKKSNRRIGFVMNRIVAYEELHVLYGPKSRLHNFPDVGWSFLIHVAKNVAIAFSHLHRFGHVVGDINPRSVLVSKDGLVKMIDCDSFQ